MNGIKNWKINNLNGGACNAMHNDFVVATFENKLECIKVIDKANGVNSVNLEWYAVPPYKESENWSILNEKGEFVATFVYKKDCLDVIKLVSV